MMTMTEFKQYHERWGIKYNDIELFNKYQDYVEGIEKYERLNKTFLNTRGK
jgi:hypothetical protein